MKLFLEKELGSIFPKKNANLIKILNKKGVKNLQDLILYIPTRYLVFKNVSCINKIKLGMKVFIQGKVLHTQYCKNNTFLCTIYDDTGTLLLKFFRFKEEQSEKFLQEKWIAVYGKISCYKKNLEIIHPEYFFLNERKNISLFKHPLPIYPHISSVKQKELRSIIQKSLNYIKEIEFPEIFPEIFKNKFMKFYDAVRFLHFPKKNAVKILENRKHPAQHRLIFEELLAYNLSMLKIRSEIKKKVAMSCEVNFNLEKKFLSFFSFKLTLSQKNAIREIYQDLKNTIPMIRLLQGDVGSGKTIIAALAALCVINSGLQVVLITPTELLAKQHKSNFKSWFLKLGIQVSYVAGKRKKSIKKKQENDIAIGKSMMIIGTQAILQKDIKFYKLALIIIDEHHRFGVNQRCVLLNKGETEKFFPHQLIITATPIPRTLAISMYANLDISTICTPLDRIPIITVVLPSQRRKEVIQRILSSFLRKKKYRVYWVCAAINNKKESKIQSVYEIYKELKKEFTNFEVGILHSRLNDLEKRKSLKDFKEGKIHLLVTTTIIEIGIDIPNANLMIIENSERLGLSQLYQLRGRIGRKNMSSSYCVLLYHPPLTKIAKLRLKIVRNENTGIFISHQDLKIRGPGKIFGTKQSGNIKFKIADFFKDQNLIVKTSRFAKYMYNNYPILSEEIINRWISNEKEKKSYLFFT